MLGRLERRDVQPVVPGQHDLEHLGHHVRHGELQRRQEGPGRGGVRDGPLDRGQAARRRTGQVHGRAAVLVERRDLAAVLEPDDRLGPGLWPQRRMAGQEAVEARDPPIVLFGEELLGHPRHHGLGRDLVQSDLVPQVPPQHRRALLADRRVREPDRPPRPAQRAELAGVEQAEHLRAAGQQQVDGHGVAAARRRDQRLGGQRVTRRVEQRPEHRTGREARLVQGQRLQGVGREQSLVAQFRQRVGQQRGGLAHQRLVRRVVAGDVVPGRRGPVGPLDQEAEEGLLLGREEHGQR